MNLEFSIRDPSGDNILGNHQSMHGILTAIKLVEGYWGMAQQSVLLPAGSSCQPPTSALKKKKVYLFILVGFVLRKGHSMQSWPDWNLLCKLDWPQTYKRSTYLCLLSAGIKVTLAMPGKFYFYFIFVSVLSACTPVHLYA